MKTLGLMLAVLFAVAYAVWEMRGVELALALLTPVAVAAFITWLIRVRVPLSILVGAAMGLGTTVVLALFFRTDDPETTTLASVLIVFIVAGLPLVMTGGIGGLIGGSLAEARRRTAV